MPLQFDAEYLKAWEPIGALLAARPRPAIHDVQTRRDGMEAGISAFMNSIPDAPEVETKVYQIEVADGVKIRVYGFQKKEASATPGPAALHCHGGGMILGSVETFQRALAAEVQRSGVPMFSVDYRLAPEVQDATLVEDCYAGLVWLNQNAKELNVDPARIAVFGESAGGGIAAGVALMARDKKLQPPLAKQILIYPMLDDRNLTPNEAIEPLAFWKTEDNITGWTALLGDKAGKSDADVSYYAAPARAKSLAGLPPAYIDVGELDIFRDEDLTYALRLTAENISTEFHLYPGVHHAFEVWCPGTSLSKAAVANRSRALQTL